MGLEPSRALRYLIGRGILRALGVTARARPGEEVK
jgi:hypothetical protein